MRLINNYITEKLRINKDTKIDRIDLISLIPEIDACLKNSFWGSEFEIKQSKDSINILFKMDLSEKDMTDTINDLNKNINKDNKISIHRSLANFKKEIIIDEA